jgi:hypothetical protein
VSSAWNGRLSAVYRRPRICRGFRVERARSDSCHCMRHDGCLLARAGVRREGYGNLAAVGNRVVIKAFLASADSAGGNEPRSRRSSCTKAVR